MIALPVHAQDVPAEAAPPTDAPAADVAQGEEPEPEVSEPVAEPEPEVSEPVAEPEVSEPEPEVSDDAAGLGTASPEAQTQDDLQEAQAETGEAAAAGTPDEGEGSAADRARASNENSGTLSAAERLASVAGGQGVPWTFPINWSNNLSVDSLRPQHRPTYNPFYSMTFSAAPRYIFSPVVSIGARMSLDVEFTDSNLTPEGRDLEWGDLQLDTTFALPWHPGGLIIAPAVAVRLPTSQLSRGQSRALGPTARLGIIKVFGVLDGLVVGGSLGYTFWVHHDGQRQQRDGTAGAGNVGVDSTGRPLDINGSAGGAPSCPGASNSPDATNFGVRGCAGGNQVRHQPSIAAFVSLVPVNHLTVSVSFAGFWLVNRGHDVSYLSPGQVVTADGQPVAVGDNSPTHTTTVTSFSASVSWDFSSWLTASIGYSTLSFYPDSDGSFENFIYNENSQFNLGLSFRPGALTTQLRSEATAEEEQAAEAAFQRVAF